MTGGSPIAARFPYGEYFEFVPGFSLNRFVTNHRPRVDGDDDGIWRRLRLIPFNVSFVGREDRDLAGTLEQELPGILTWALHGCLDWQRTGWGSRPPSKPRPRSYRVEEDLGAFIAEHCRLDWKRGTRRVPGCLRAVLQRPRRATAFRQHCRQAPFPTRDHTRNAQRRLPRDPDLDAAGGSSVNAPAVADLLTTPGALLTRSHLRELGLERRAIDQVFRHCPVVSIPGYSRPMIRAEDYVAFIEQHTYQDDRVRPFG